MALTIATALLPEFKVNVPNEGRTRTAVVQWTLSGTYATGGHSYAGLEPSLFQGLRVPVLVEFPGGGFRNGTAAVLPFWDRTNKKIMFFQTTTGAPTQLLEVANATSLASYVGLVKVTGY